MRVKVLHILGAIVAGGAELELLKILSSWKDNRFTFSVFYTRESEQLRSRFADIDICTTHLEWKNERDFGKILSMVKLFRKERPHIVHTHLWTGNYWVVIAARLANVPIIIETIHGAHPHKKLGFFLHRMLRPIMPFLVNATICVGRNVKEYLTKKIKQPSRNITVIYNGIEEHHTTCENEVQYLKNTFQLHNSVPILITVANLRPVIKGYDVYLEALHKIYINNKCDFRTLIVGDVQIDHPLFFDYLKNKAKDLRLKDKVIFLGYRSDVAELLAASDIFVLPSRYEGAPLAVIEAMRAGIPVIATRTGAVPEYVIDGETGLIVEPGDSNALANAIEYMLNHPEKWHEMGERGRERFKNNFTIDKTVEQLTNLYKSLLRKKGLVDKS